VDLHAKGGPMIISKPTRFCGSWRLDLGHQHVEA
jgi:hypothetical protein